MRWPTVLLAAAIAPILCAGPTAKEFATALAQTTFDTAQCFRVRDITVVREDLRVYLTDGYLLFAKPVQGRHLAAYYFAENEGGDGELLLVPPDAAERTTLARFTESPNLNEHFRGAMLLFSDATGQELLQKVAESGAKPDEEMGRILSGTYNSVLKNFFSSFEMRLVGDLLAGPTKPGLFFMALAGKTLGNFDIAYDPTVREQITVGQLNFRNNVSYFDVWASFAGRSVRQGRVPLPREGSGFKTEHYDIKAEITADLKLKAVTTTRVVVTEEGLRALNFDVSRQVRVLSAKINGQPVEFFQRESLRSNLIRARDGDVFLLVPPQPLAANQTLEVSIEHEADVIRNAGNGVYFVSARGSWYPQSGVQFATYDLSFKYPVALQVVSAGQIIEDRSDAETHFTKRRISQRIRMVGFNLGDYSKATVTRGPLTGEVYANRQVEAALARRTLPAVAGPPPFPQQRRRNEQMASMPMDVATAPDPVNRAQRLATEVADIFAMFRERFGEPSVPQLKVSPIPGTFGQGFPGLIYLSTLAYLNAAERPPIVGDAPMQVFYSDLLHAHEVAHQWWGNRVASSGIGDDWMMEAFANYSSLLQLERKKGTKALDSILADYRKHLLQKTEDGQTIESVGPIRLGLRLENSQSPEAWRIITYEKGAWIMHMLRRRLGDANFYALLRQVCTDFAGRTLTTPAFRTLAAILDPRTPLA